MIRPPTEWIIHRNLLPVSTICPEFTQIHNSFAPLTIHLVWSQTDTVHLYLVSLVCLSDSVLPPPPLFLSLARSYFMYEPVAVRQVSDPLCRCRRKIPQIRWNNTGYLFVLCFTIHVVTDVSFITHHSDDCISYQLSHISLKCPYLGVGPYNGRCSSTKSAHFLVTFLSVFSFSLSAPPPVADTKSFL